MFFGDIQKKPRKYVFLGFLCIKHSTIWFWNFRWRAGARKKQRTILQIIKEDIKTHQMHSNIILTARDDYIMLTESQLMPILIVYLITSVNRKVRIQNHCIFQLGQCLLT